MRRCAVPWCAGRVAGARRVAHCCRRTRGGGWWSPPCEGASCALLPPCLARKARHMSAGPRAVPTAALPRAWGAALEGQPIGRSTAALRRAQGAARPGAHTVARGAPRPALPVRQSNRPPPQLAASTGAGHPASKHGAAIAHPSWVSVARSVAGDVGWASPVCPLRARCPLMPAATTAPMGTRASRRRRLRNPWRRGRIGWRGQDGERRRARRGLRQTMGASMGAPVSVAGCAGVAATCPASE